MEPQKVKVAMYVKRSFGEKLDASFDFIKENWKILLKLTTYLLLPLCLIQALSLIGLMNGVFNLAAFKAALDVSTLWSGNVLLIVYYFIYLILTIIGWTLFSSLAHALIRTYNTREERLKNITLKELKPLLMRNIKRQIVLMFFLVVLSSLSISIIYLLGYLTLLTLIITIPLFIAFAVPIALLNPIYLLEDISFFNAFRKMFRLGFATWGGVLLISLLMGIIGSVIQGVIMAPWYVATLVKYLFSISDTGDAATVSTGYTFLLYLLGVIQSFGAYISMIFTIVGLAYQYGHASEVVDSIKVEDDIDYLERR